MMHHVECIDSWQRRLERKERTEDLPLAKTAPLAKCTKDRLKLTVSSHRMRYSFIQLLVSDAMLKQSYVILESGS